MRGRGRGRGRGDQASGRTLRERTPPPPPEDDFEVYSRFKSVSIPSHLCRWKTSHSTWLVVAMEPGVVREGSTG